MSDFNLFKIQLPEHLFRDIGMWFRQMWKKNFKGHDADTIDILEIFEELNLDEEKLFVKLLKQKNKKVIVEPMDGSTILHIGVQMFSDEVFDIWREPWSKNPGFPVQHICIRKQYYKAAKKKKKDILKMWNGVWFRDDTD